MSGGSRERGEVVALPTSGETASRHEIERPETTSDYVTLERGRRIGADDDPDVSVPIRDGASQ
ncbi:hypothetical protein GWG54_04905 [Natronococcus sp. JC468]|uniref:hypothetical protein n=1 Tax=Natronococcus sp. JC468 TaxID=1961921 RepID=UPI00143AD31D|nr:hypothetical protein [Natronococcus sp. JC468]NKE35168.1 hypothetical protein [Natronococcus sp. JC468]